MSEPRFREAAMRVLSDATGLNVEQAHEIILRDADRNEQNPWLVTLVPLGTIVGVRVRRQGDGPAPSEDDGLAFISLRALISALPALGIGIRPGVPITTGGIIAEDAKRQAG